MADQSNILFLAWWGGREDCRRAGHAHSVNEIGLYYQATGQIGKPYEKSLREERARARQQLFRETKPELKDHSLPPEAGSSLVIYAMAQTRTVPFIIHGTPLEIAPRLQEQL